LIRVLDGVLESDSGVPKMVHSGNVSDPLESPTPEPILEVRFFQTSAGNEPVRDWFKEQIKDDRRSIGEDIKTAQFGWPLGMPLVRKLEKTPGKFARASPMESPARSSP
jgi:hypothetical protein